MNFVAHARIAADWEHFMLGQLLGDFAINSVLIGQHPELVRGVRAHRALDAWTDQHPLFLEACRLLQPGCGRYAPVVMDVLLDHVLVQHWAVLGNGPGFSDFLGKLYTSLRTHAQHLPERMRIPAERMHVMHWFSGFAEPSSLERVLGFMSKRVRRPHLIQAASQTIESSWENLESLSLELLQEPALNGFSVDRFSS